MPVSSTPDWAAHPVQAFGRQAPAASQRSPPRCADRGGLFLCQTTNHTDSPMSARPTREGWAVELRFKEVCSPLGNTRGSQWWLSVTATRNTFAGVRRTWRASRSSARWSDRRKTASQGSRGNQDAVTDGSRPFPELGRHSAPNPSSRIAFAGGRTNPAHWPWHGDTYSTQLPGVVTREGLGEMPECKAPSGHGWPDRGASAFKHLLPLMESEPHPIWLMFHRKRGPAFLAPAKLGRVLLRKNRPKPFGWLAPPVGWLA